MLAKPSSIMLILLIIGASISADDWQWRKIAWDDMKVWSAASPPDSGNIIYVSICEGTDRGVHKSTDGGYTWRFLTESQTHFAYMLTVNPEEQSEVYCGSWSISDSPGTWPQRSRDAGENWEELAKPLTRLVPSPWYVGVILGTQTDNIGFYAMYRSADDGSTWDLITTSMWQFWPRRTSENAVFHPSDSLMVVACYFEQASGRYGLGASHDGGITWEMVLDGEIVGFDEDPIDPDHWIAIIQLGGAGSPGTVAETYDSWQTYETWALPDSVVWVNQILFDRFDSNTLYLLDTWSAGPPAESRYERRGVLRSTNSGGTWESMNSGLADSIVVTGLVSINGSAGELLAVARDGLWKWTNKVRGEPQANQVASLQIEGPYPNPFQTVTRGKIEQELCGSVNASVYDIRGNAVRNVPTSKIDESAHVVFWDGRDDQGYPVPGGAYLLTAWSGNTRIVRRLVKIR